MKAGVALREEDAAREAEGETGAEAARDIEYLLVEVAGRQAAVPLSDVLRIEQLPLNRIEYIGFRPVLNFEGQLLPVDDSGGVLTAAQGNSAAQVIVVVCREGNRQVGIAVSHVLDVAGGGELFEAGSEQITSGVTLLKDHVTGVVDLGGVVRLAAGQQAPAEWSQMRETVA
jgi:two-component system chemotaxis sensor kinase CheA